MRFLYGSGSIRGIHDAAALHDDGYEDDFSGAVIASAAVLGPVIPPSIIMVIYASISGDSVAKLFMGGLVPGVIIGALLMVVAYVISVKRGLQSQVHENGAPA